MKFQPIGTSTGGDLVRNATNKPPNQNPEALTPQGKGIVLTQELLHKSSGVLLHKKQGALL